MASPLFIRLQGTFYTFTRGQNYFFKDKDLDYSKIFCIFAT